MATIGPTAGYTRARQNARLGADIFKRQRYSLHDRSMRMSDAKSRLRSGDPNWNNPGFSDGEGSSGAPTMGETPELEMPEYDEKKVSALTQKKAAPGIRRLRNVTQRALSTTHENPNVQRMTVREALAGYGTGLEGVISGAGSSARAEYNTEYSTSVSAAMARYQAALNRQSQEYSVRSQDWLMGRAKYWEDEYKDPYDAFRKFYGEKASGGGGGGGFSLTQSQIDRRGREKEFWDRPFTRARTRSF